jgi:hypothetical protein
MMLCQALGEPDLVLVNLDIQAGHAPPAGRVGPGAQSSVGPPTHSAVIDTTIALLSDETVRLRIRLL